MAHRAGTSEISVATGFVGGIFKNTAPDFLQLDSEMLFGGDDANLDAGLYLDTITSSKVSEISLTKAGPATAVAHL